MVELEITKEYSKNEERILLINNLKKIRIGKYKVNCEQNSKRIKVVLNSLYKQLVFLFYKRYDGYLIKINKTTKEVLLLSKAIEKLSGKNVTIRLGNNTIEKLLNKKVGTQNMKSNEMNFNDEHNKRMKKLEILQVLTPILCIMIVGLSYWCFCITNLEIFKNIIALSSIGVFVFPFIIFLLSLKVCEQQYDLDKKFHLDTY